MFLFGNSGSIYVKKNTRPMSSVGKTGFIKKNMVWLLLNVKNKIINIRLGRKKKKQY